MTAPPLIRLRLLGRFSAAICGEPPAQLKISSRKGVALLAYLALHPEHSVSREKLATLLWGDRPDRQARLSLRQAILSLRKSFGESEPIALDGDTVCLRMDRVGVDALEFQKLSRSTDLDDLDRAAALYAGPFLSELEIDSEDFAAWLETVRTRFGAEAARVLESCAEQRELLEQGDAAIDAAERLVALDPLREDWQRRLLRISARHRGAEVALVHAKTLIALLRKELDVGPEPATSELIEDIRRGAIEPARPALPLALLAESSSEIVPPPGVMENMPSTAGLTAVSAVMATPPHRQASPWRAGVGTLWFIVPVSVLFAGALLLGNPRLTPVRRTVATVDIVGSTNARLEPAPVVVLPFEAADKQDDAMAELVSDNVIDQLSRVPNLRVISRLTSHQFWQASRDIVDVGNRLNVRYAVHGRVKAEQDRWRVNVELIDVTSRSQLWSDQFDQGSPDGTEAAGMIASQLGRAVEVAAIRQQADRDNSQLPPKPAIDGPNPATPGNNARTSTH